MKVGDLVCIKGEREVMLVTADLSDISDQVMVLRNGRFQYLRKSQLEVISESR